MGLFGGGAPARVVRGRAFVVPGSTANAGSGVDGNVNNFAANARVTSTTLLAAVSAEDGQPVATASKRITARLPNWLRIVMYYAGTNYEPQEQLPAELHVPVVLNADTREIWQLDVDGAEAELAAYREAARRFWLQTEAPLSSVRGAFALPGMAVRGAKEFVNDWRGTFRDLRTGTHRPPTEKELEQQRRTAVALRYRFERNPKELAKVREGVIAHGPGMAQGARAGSYPREDFAAWVVFQETSGVITAEEAAALRETAGLAE